MLKIGKRKGAGLSSGHANKSQASDVELYGAIRDELDAMKNGLAGLMVKLDADFTAQNAVVTNSQLDVDYASTLSVGSNLFEK